MLYAVWDNAIIVMQTEDQEEAWNYANYRASITGSRVTVSTYSLVTSDEVNADDA